MYEIKEISDYSIERRKELGAYYSPQVLSDFLAKTILSFYSANSRKDINALDPATGDSVLLYSLSKYAQSLGLDINVIGVDIDPHAIERSQTIFQGLNIQKSFVCTDSLFPYDQRNPFAGWKMLRNKYLPNGIDIIVSNPPWGADLSSYSSLGQHYTTALGQYDSYDLFVETILNNLNEGGLYAIIIPDSIYCKEHYNTRKLLLDNTTICEIVRLGEGFFSDVNFAVSLLFGIKRRSKGNKVKCVHLSNKDRKDVLKGNTTLEFLCEHSAIYVDSKMMISNDYSFITDVSDLDIPLMSKLNACPKFEEFVISHRGVELSKKGKVLRCPECGMWFPEPKKKAKTANCPHCKSIFNIVTIKEADSIISEKSSSNSNMMVVGEDISRYQVSPNKYIKLGYNGIKYKDKSLYEGVKVLVRKTGVGITAGIDYKSCLVNQVVYIIKPKEDASKALTCEVLLALLNSRIMTYYIIKQFGSTGWKSNPYLSQENVLSLPFPRIDLDNEETKGILCEIFKLVKKISNVKTISNEYDLAIECLVAKLYGIRAKDYQVILGTIRSVESLIPFKRLLYIKEEDINNGL